MASQPIGYHGRGSYDVIRFYLGLLLGQMSVFKLKVLINHLLFVLGVWDFKPTYRKSCSGSLLMLGDLTLDPSFKVKQG